MNPIKTRVLVVDDSSSARQSICDLLHDLGFPAVDEASDEASALGLFQRTHYDVVIADWGIGGSGIELLRAIRHGNDRRETPVLVLGSQVSTARVVEAIEAGASGFMAKPIVAPRLSAKVLRMVAALAPVDFGAPQPSQHWSHA